MAPRAFWWTREDGGTRADDCEGYSFTNLRVKRPVVCMAAWLDTNAPCTWCQRNSSLLPWSCGRARMYVLAPPLLDISDTLLVLISITNITDQGLEVDEMLRIHERLRWGGISAVTFRNWRRGMHKVRGCSGIHLAILAIHTEAPKHQEYSNWVILALAAWRWRTEHQICSPARCRIRNLLPQRRHSRVSLSPAQHFTSRKSDFANLIFSQTFYWLWVPLIQERLDQFRHYWNNHRISSSKNKVNPSGWSPKTMIQDPSLVQVNARDCSIRVSPETVQHLRESYGGEEARDRAYRFVSTEFQAEADDVYVALGCPTITLQSGWDVFVKVVAALEERRAAFPVEWFDYDSLVQLCINYIISLTFVAKITPSAIRLYIKSWKWLLCEHDDRDDETVQVLRPKNISTAVKRTNTLLVLVRRTMRPSPTEP